MTQVKEEKIERAANYARVMHEQTMLGAFVRLADYMFVEGEREKRTWPCCYGEGGLLCFGTERVSEWFC